MSELAASMRSQRDALPLSLGPACAGTHAEFVPADYGDEGEFSCVTCFVERRAGGWSKADVDWYRRELEEDARRVYAPLRGGS